MAAITADIQLQELDQIPDGLLTAQPDNLLAILQHPTLLHLKGNHDTTLFVSIMLHGNETTGLYAVQEILKKYQQQALPRNLSIFFGNIHAAQAGLRRIDGQPDYNRIWPGTDQPACAETELAAAIIRSMADRNLFASVDIHNNTGLNPHYACINVLQAEFTHLATLFSRLVVYFTRPQGVQSAAFAELCPAVTLECGRPDQSYGTSHAVEFLDSCLHLDHFPDHPVHAQDIDLFHTVAQVKVKPDIHFSFTDQNSQLVLDQDLEKMNFFEVPAGTAIGVTALAADQLFDIRNENGEVVTQRFVETTQNEVRFKRPTMPSMMTLNEQVIRQDCLCYLMERISL